MQASTSFATNRLLLTPVTINDNPFIFELVNTEGWLKFIGNRNINSPEEAVPYIGKMTEKPNRVWVVRLKENQNAIGIITFITRDYLAHPDIGFAFLPGFAGNGYAFEATEAMLKNLMQNHNLPHMLATTLPENIRSIRLLEKLGLRFEKEIEQAHETLHVYGISADELEKRMKAGKSVL